MRTVLSVTEALSVTVIFALELVSTNVVSDPAASIKLDGVPVHGFVNFQRVSGVGGFIEVVREVIISGRIFSV